jgi:hypothetical protein
MAIYFIILLYLKLEGDLKEIVGEIKADFREIVIIVGHWSYLLHEFKYPENVRFSEPEARP